MYSLNSLPRKTRCRPQGDDPKLAFPHQWSSFTKQGGQQLEPVVRLLSQAENV